MDTRREPPLSDVTPAPVRSAVDLRWLAVVLTVCEVPLALFVAVIAVGYGGYLGVATRGYILGAACVAFVILQMVCVKMEFAGSRRGLYLLALTQCWFVAGCALLFAPRG